MIRISKIADYGTVVMAYLAKSNSAHNARTIATKTHLKLPTVSKVLKLLVKGGMLISERGVQGGYQLSRPAKDISVAQIIAALNNPVSLTECTHDVGVCAIEEICCVKYNWRMINNTIDSILQKISLADMLKRNI